MTRPTPHATTCPVCETICYALRDQFTCPDATCRAKFTNEGSDKVVTDFQGRRLNHPKRYEFKGGEPRAGVGYVKARETRFSQLGYRLDSPNNWRIVDMASDASIGPHYRTKGELLADLARFASEYGIA